MARFDGLSVLVTGAARGFGAGAARAFAAEGARVLCSDVLDCTPVAEEIGGLAMHADVTKPEDHRALVARALSEWGALDIAVNNAGIVHLPMPLQTLPEAWARKVVEVDLLGVIWALQAQIPVMTERFKQDGRRAAIVNLASVAGLVGAPGLGVYGAAKHGVVGLTRTAAVENARRGLRVNAVCPAFAKTAMVDDTVKDAPDAEAATQDMVRGVPMRRLAEVGEVVQAILWAADPANSFTTGQALAIDGGITAY